MKFASNRRLLLVLLVLSLCIVFHVALFVWASHSEGFKYVDKTVRKSAEIRRRIGDVRAVRLAFIGGYRERFVGPRESATLAVDVVGLNGSATVKAAVQSIDGVWSVTKSSIDGKPADIAE